jgi:class 3 adenylate cyclase
LRSRLKNTKKAVPMKKKYYLSMLSLLGMMLLFDGIYFVLHQSLQIFLMQTLGHFLVLGPLNLLVSYVLYQPIDRAFSQGVDTKQAKKRINQLTWYSTGAIFFLGILFIVILFLLLFLFPTNTEGVAEMDKVSPILMLTLIPSIIFFQAIFPAFVTYFLINDFSLDLKEKAFLRFKILFSVGKKRIGITLLFVFIILGFIPSLLIILELVAVASLGDDYAKFTTLNPLATVFVDRFVLLVGMIIAVILINRSFTKPIYSLLKEINKVREGDYSTQAAITTEDEIGVLTKEFNEMVKGLQEREFIRDTFGKYVTKDVATVILDKKINLEGEVRMCTILVTDIANYTTISEELAPKEIVQMLNEYFSVLVNIIQSHKGVVNKFIGDAIFAMFNVPLDDPDHAVNAIHAALAIEKITSHQVFGKNKQLTTRIGINTGVVVAGNIGSADRLEYTVIGDEVNIAARLEQLNKEYGTHILLGENTYEMAKNHFDFIQLGDCQLKGKERVIKVYKIDY